MTGAPADDAPSSGHLRQAAFRIARTGRLPIPPAERLTETDRIAARLSLYGVGEKRSGGG